MRLDRFLAETGYGTRTEVKKLIRSGRVQLGGTAALRPETHIDEARDEVFVDGALVEYKKFIYLMLNKPQGYVSATWDKKLPTVIDLLPTEYLHFQPFPVGRLDIDTEGLLILTNDGGLSHRLLSPKKHVPKTYIAKLATDITDDAVEVMRRGVTLDDGYKTMPAELSAENGDMRTARIVIGEGKFHQVKRMFEAVGNEVLYLKRIMMNELPLDETLPLGEVRELTTEEMRLLETLEEERK